ncbi:hypothetical protein G2W53_008227 [Senna tora]|uniref:Uncharacterized protein n=1 Tax=Senna tora TaxID=362788 RepID=A0A835CGS4_9FABA|nr:hypothetical protein G2W53_008227 [Senna tora]
MPEFPRQFPNGKTTELFHYPIFAIMSMGLLCQPIPMASYEKDTPIIRMGQRTFFFTFPGLLYALQFPRVCGPTVIAYLNIVRPLAEPMAPEILLLFGHRPGLSRFYVSNHNSSYTRAIRLSATTRTMMEAFVSGSLTLSCITIQDSHNEPPCIPARASITVFTCLVDALEASTLVSHGFKKIPLLDSRNNACYPSLGFRVWRLNNVGVINFVRGLDATVKNEEECVLSKTVEESSSDEEKGEEVTSNVDDKGKGKQVMP